MATTANSKQSASSKQSGNQSQGGNQSSRKGSSRRSDHPVWVITIADEGFALQELASANGVRTFPSLDAAMKQGANEAEESEGTLLVYGYGGRLSDKLSFTTEPRTQDGIGDSERVACEVSRDDEHGWAVRPNGPTDQRVRYFGSKNEAMKFARSNAQECGCPLVVYYGSGEMERIVLN
jgi:hypothetical protein